MKHTIHLLKHRSGSEWRGRITWSGEPSWAKNLPDLIAYRFEVDDGPTVWLTNEQIRPAHGDGSGNWWWEINDSGKRKVEREIKKADKAAERTISGANI